MKELSLNILDVTENSVKAGASLTEILLEETEETLTITIRDNGCGMDEETVKSVIDPFYTTRTTRKVGLGVPLLKMAAEQTDGSFNVESSVKEENHGTVVTALFYKHHLDFTPLGDIVSTLTTLIQGHPDTDFYFSHKKGGGEVTLDTRELREVLEGVPLNSYEVIKWIEEYLKEQYSLIG
ncbi:MAG: sensor histidine kinase [Ruminococcaceae bacterium]|jgi:signal transduction histidine kinase|nr:sensor histidine kinase [Oscillospiraceae bacterium]